MAEADEVMWAAVVGQALALGFEAARTHRGPDAWQLLTSREWASEQAERVRLPVMAGSGHGVEARDSSPVLRRARPRPLAAPRPLASGVAACRRERGRVGRG